MHTRKIFIVSAMVFLMCIFVRVPVFGQAILVLTEEYPPYNYSENGNVLGFCTEVVEEVLKRAHLDYSIHSYPGVKSYTMAQSEPNVLIYSIRRNGERESLFKWVGVIAKTEVYFFKLKSRRDIKIKTFDDIKKYKVGAVRDDFRAQWLIKQGLTNQLDWVTDDRYNMRKLFDHEIDIFPVDEFVAYHIAHQEGYAFNDLEKTLYVKDVSVDLYMAFSNQTSDIIVEKCEKALLEMKNDGTYEKIASKYAIFCVPDFRFRCY